MARRRSDLAKVEVWLNENPADLSDVWIAGSPVVDGRIYADRPWTALAAIAALWGQKSTAPSSRSERQCERYTYSIAWDETSEVFVATVAEFPELSRRSPVQMLAFCDLLTDVREHVRELERKSGAGDDYGTPISAPNPALGPGGNIIDLVSRRRSHGGRWRRSQT